MNKKVTKTTAYKLTINLPQSHTSTKYINLYAIEAYGVTMDAAGLISNEETPREPGKFIIYIKTGGTVGTLYNVHFLTIGY